MKKTIFIVFIWSLLFLAACAQQKEVESKQSVQDIVSQTPDYEDVAKEVKPVEQPKVVQNTTVAINKTVTNATEITFQTDDKPIINKKCRNSAILYGGCKWTDDAHTNFNLKIKSASKSTITGTWIIVKGDSGGIIYMKRPEDILSEAIRTYSINEDDLEKQVGKILRIEVLPIEIMNSTEYGCENQKIYTVPDTYCKVNEPTRINADGSINMSDS